MTYDPFTEAYQQQPTDPRCERVVEITIVGDRCIYINDYRVQGGKPYVSEGLPSKTKATPLREILNAFSRKDIEAYLREHDARKAFYAGLRAYRDAVKEDA